MRGSSVIAELIDDAEEPELATNERQAIDSGGHTDLEQPAQQIKLRAEQACLQAQPHASAHENDQNGDDYPELGNALLVCATETKTDADIAAFASALADVLASQEKQSA